MIYVIRDKSVVRLENIGRCRSKQLRFLVNNHALAETRVLKRRLGDFEVESSFVVTKLLDVVWDTSSSARYQCHVVCLHID